jgi:tetratricopeptide (TPR) repeat protein
MRFERSPEPDEFDLEVRQKGNAWLAKNPHKKAKDFPDYWNKFKPQLFEGFQQFCAYSVTFIIVDKQGGTVDHYLCKSDYPQQAYEWNNYRYALPLINSYKGAYNSYKQPANEWILDPFEVEDNWFELLLPSLQLVLTDAVPSEKRKHAEFTLKKLRLTDDEALIDYRTHWYELYQEGLPLEKLEKKAPLIARSVKRCQDYYQKGNDCYNREDYQGAIENYNQAIRINAVYAEAYLGRGQAYYQLRDDQQALKDYDEAIHQNPKQVETFFWRGLIHYQNKNYPQAIEDFNQIIQQYPNKAEAY